MSSVCNRTTPAARSLRVLAALLGYPDAERRGFLPQMGKVLRQEAALSAAAVSAIEVLIGELAGGDPLDVEADYVALFDRGRATSLHLFEHVHGDSRERGPAMVDLAQTYAQAGLLLAPGELPDYLPVVLEFVSTQPAAEAQAFLAEMAHIFGAIFSSLQQRGSPYACVLGALLEIAGEPIVASAPLAGPEPEQGLDATWAEPLAFDGCSTKGQAKPGQEQVLHFVPRTQPHSAQPGAAA